MCVCVSWVYHYPKSFAIFQIFKNSFSFYVWFRIFTNTFTSKIVKNASQLLTAILGGRLQRHVSGVVPDLVRSDNWVLKSLGGFQEGLQVWCLRRPVYIGTQTIKKKIYLSCICLLSFNLMLSPIGKISGNSFKDWHRLTAHCRGEGLPVSISSLDFNFVKLFFEIIN